MSSVRTAVTVVGGRLSARGARMLAVALSTLLSTVMLSAGATALAAPADATDEPPRQGGATASLEGLKTYGQAVVREDGEELKTGAGLFEMAVDGGGMLQTYGMDVDNPTQQHARYGETDWNQTSLHDNPDAGKILWILRHSYPQVNDLQGLAKSSGAGSLTPAKAAAGTQVAIWRFTDGAGAEGNAEITAADPAAEKLADHLQREARAMAEPKASLSLDRADVSGGKGGRLGPVTVRTGASSVAVVPTSGPAARGVRVVGRNGEPVEELRDGGRLYFEVPGKSRVSGSSSLTVQAATKVPVGRAFTGVGGHARSQAQILAGSSESTVSATATVSWAKDGAIPAVTAEKNCAGGGVKITVANAGDRLYDFSVAGGEHRTAAGSSKTVTVPVGEDQAYRIPVAGTGGLKRTVSGVLDCATRSAVAAGADEAGSSPQTRTATVGGGEGDADAVVDGDLAETGSSNTPLILGVAVGLVILGSVAMLVVRRRAPGDGGEEQGDR